MGSHAKNEIKFYKKWWFWLGTLLVIVIIGFIINLNYKTIFTSTALNKKVTVGQLTYYIEEGWESKEDSDGIYKYNYYYPAEDTMLMIMVASSNSYGDDTSINSFLDSYISGMNLNKEDFISKNTKEINGHNYGIVRYYTYSNKDKYEAISYIVTNNNECYVFTIGKKNKLNDKLINIVENIISKAEIKVETEAEKQARIQQEKIEKEKQEAEEKARKEKEEAEKKAKEEQDEKNFKSSCNTYSYEQIARNPEKVKGKNVKVTGEVIQVMSDSYSTNLRVNITKTGTYSTYYTDTIYVVYYPKNGEDKILENDIITIYGTSQGDCSYTTVLGTTVTLPNIKAEYITIENK